MPTFRILTNNRSLPLYFKIEKIPDFTELTTIKIFFNFFRDKRNIPSQPTDSVFVDFLASESHFLEDLVNTIGISKVSFYNKADESMVFKVNLVGTSKNQVRVANLLTAFKADLVILEDGSILESDEEGFSVDTFNAGVSFGITIVAQKHKNSEILEASSSHTGKFFYYQFFCSITFCFHYKNSIVCISQC